MLKINYAVSKCLFRKTKSKKVSSNKKASEASKLKPLSSGKTSRTTQAIDITHATT